MCYNDDRCAGRSECDSQSVNMCAAYDTIKNKSVFIYDTDIWAGIFNVSVRMDIFLCFGYEICDVVVEKYKL